MLMLVLVLVVLVMPMVVVVVVLAVVGGAGGGGGGVDWIGVHRVGLVGALVLVFNREHGSRYPTHPTIEPDLSQRRRRGPSPWLPATSFASAMPR